MSENKTYIAIDLKSFYASVECVERSLNPLATNLVVADKSRTNKTICLAVTPPLKAYGLSGRSRLFEVVQTVKKINDIRRLKAPNQRFIGCSFNDAELKANPSLELSYVAAPPRMALYIKYSAKIYEIYLKYFSCDDMVVYSIDEVFIDATNYFKMYKMSGEELTKMVIKDVLKQTGITATAGIGTNLYLCKAAMDIMAKRAAPDKDGVRIAKLTELSYKKQLWGHRPLTDFWRVGGGYAKKLEENGLFTMGDIAKCSLGGPNDFYNEDLLYKLFGVNAELLIDHAWGYEPCTIKHIKAYKPTSKSLSSGQVLQNPYSFEKALLATKEMADLLSLDLAAKGLASDKLVLTIGYDVSNLTDKKIKSLYRGEITTDSYGRKTPKHAHGTINLEKKTSSCKIILKAVAKLYNQIVNKNLLVRRINVTAANVERENAFTQKKYKQLNLFEDQKAKEAEIAALEKEKNTQTAILDIKKKFGKNAILRGINLEEGATAKMRNEQIGGHKA